jgi:hypothetical protein
MGIRSVLRFESVPPRKDDEPPIHADERRFRGKIGADRRASAVSSG